MVKVKFCRDNCYNSSTSYGSPAIVFSIVLRQHLRSNAKANTANTSHVFPLCSAQPDPIDQSFASRQLSFAHCSPWQHAVCLLCLLAKLWHGCYTVSQAKRHSCTLYLVHNLHTFTTYEFMTECQNQLAALLYLTYIAYIRCILLYYWCGARRLIDRASQRRAAWLKKETLKGTVCCVIFIYDVEYNSYIGCQCNAL